MLSRDSCSTQRLRAFKLGQKGKSCCSNYYLFVPKLAQVMRLLKGGSAKLINDQMGRKGAFWLQDYYDTLIRDDEHFIVAYRYIQNNPRGLGEDKTSFPRFYGIYD